MNSSSSSESVCCSLFEFGVISPKIFSVSETFLIRGSSPTLSWNVTIALSPLSIAERSSSFSLSSKPTYNAWTMCCLGSGKIPVSKIISPSGFKFV